jgi:signal transduction histidine kinase
MCLQLLHALDDEVPYQEALVYLVDPDTARLQLAAVCDRERNFRQAGRYLRELPNFTVELAHGRNLPNVVCQAGKSIRVADSLVDRRFTGLSDRLRSYLAVPIEVNDRVIGAMQIGDPLPDRYDDHDERQVATLAHFAALWIENIRLFEEAAKVEAFKKVDQLKSELLSTVSHELRTPLASIKGYASSLLREDVEWEPETRREFLQVIDEESDRLTALIEDLLQMSEIEAGVLRVDRQPVKISRLAQKVVKKLRPHARDHQVSVNIVADVPETMADPRRIEQVLHNLIVNATKYSPEGTSILVRVERRGSDILVSVRDQGIGIPLEHVDHVFERFYRVDGTLARQTGGSGLGLPICRGIVEAHGGRIWVESQLSKGSTFFFSIPLSAPEVIASAHADQGELVLVAHDD